MSREVMGATADDDPYRVPGIDADVSHDLDDDRGSGDDLTHGTRGHTVGARPRPRSAIATQAPAAVTAALGLTAAVLGWFAPDLLAATNPPPPVAVATVREFGIVSSDVGALVLDLRIEVTNLGPTRVTVTDPRPASGFAPLSVIPEGTGTTPLRITPDCGAPAGPTLPQVRVSDAAGSTVDLPVTGTRALLAQTCALSGLVPPGSGGGTGVDPRSGPAVQSGSITTDGDRLVLPLASGDARGTLLRAVTLGDLSLTVRAAPVALGTSPTRVVLEPVRSCPADWATSSPPTDLVLTLSAPASPHVTTNDNGNGNGNGNGGSGPDDRVPTYSAYLMNLPEVTMWVLRTGCSGGTP